MGVMKRGTNFSDDELSLKKINECVTEQELTEGLL